MSAYYKIQEHAPVNMSSSYVHYMVCVGEMVTDTGIEAAGLEA